MGEQPQVLTTPYRRALPTPGIQSTAGDVQHESLRLFEEGIERLRAVRDRWAGAEAKVKQLLGDQD